MPRRKRKHAEFLDPDLPIIPMLDMSFQLLAFFIITFKPMPTEGQIAMSLPPAEEGGEAAVALPDITSQKPVKYIARVQATELGGRIASIQLTEEGSADAEGTRFGGSHSDVEAFLAECKKLVSSERAKRDLDPDRPPPKLTLEIADKVLQDYVVQVFDAAIQAGFTDVAPVPIDKKAR
jgi:biopolymer transport protein ExbD